MKKIFLAFVLALTCFMLQAQPRLAGYLYTYQTGAKERFEYSVSTSYSDGAYKTIYRLYRPGVGKNRYTITASHFKDQKKVIVEVNDEQYIMTTMTGKEETTYDVPSLKPFGIQGSVAILDKAAPVQLAVKFISGRFEYVSVLVFLGSSEDGIFEYFIFNENDKISERKGLSNENNIHQPSAPFPSVNPQVGSCCLPEPSVILGYTYRKLCDSLKSRNIKYKKDSVFGEGMFYGFKIQTDSGEYFLTRQYSIGSYQFTVPIEIQSIVTFYEDKGAIIKKREGPYCLLKYKNWFIEINEIDITKSLIAYSKG